MSNARKGTVRVRRSAIDRAEPAHCSGWRTESALNRMARRHRRNWPTKTRVHDLRHTYASLARRAVADLRLLQKTKKTIGHASITVMAHVYADLCDDELDVVASALDALDDRPSE
jgi:integrase